MYTHSHYDVGGGEILEGSSARIGVFTTKEGWGLGLWLLK